jgi:hypothetical protein
MIINSRLTKQNYQWIRIPRTATIAYSNLFLPKKDNKTLFIHSHLTYNKFFTCNNCKNYGKMNLNAFTLVRNPIDRFISSIYFMAARRENLNKNRHSFKNFNKYCEICGKIEAFSTNNEQSKNIFLKFYQNESFFYNFLYDIFDKNCQLKRGIDVYTAFETNDISLLMSFFQTQVYWAYHPKVKIFKYEEIHKFNEWIESELGYDTSKLTHINTSKKEELKDVVNIDFTTDKFKKLVKHLFYDDFRYFNYEFPV